MPENFNLAVLDSGAKLGLSLLLLSSSAHRWLCLSHPVPALTESQISTTLQHPISGPNPDSEIVKPFLSGDLNLPFLLLKFMH